MQLLFIENREKTRFWAAVARRLEAQGFSIAWAVQNPLFAAGLPGAVHVMSFPPRATAESPWEPEAWPLLVTDRGRQYFGAGHAHYAHYAQQFAEIFDLVRPTLVMGEVTLFHELLAVREARARNIPYLHPSAERYPQDRFCFFHDLTQHAFGGSGQACPASDALAYTARFGKGQVTLTYMRAGTLQGQALRQLKWAWTRGRVFAARLSGERYNTPSAFRKWQLSHAVRSRLAEWHRMARTPFPNEQVVLYPMQMAPEANIEIWGRPYHNQVQVIRDLLEAMPAGVKLALKCNPKPKYELCDELIALAQTDTRIILLPVAMSMAQAMAQVIGAITVCGTVGFEACLGRGRCISLRHPVITQVCPTLAATTPQEALRRLLDEPATGVGSDADSVALLQALYKRSYPGYISDPFSSPECLDPTNIELVASAISDVSTRLSSYPQPQEIPQ